MRMIVLAFVVLTLCGCAGSRCSLEFRRARVLPVEGWEARDLLDSGRSYHVAPEAFLTEEHVAEAKVVEFEGQLAIDIRFDERGAELFAKYTEAHIGEHVAVIIDGQLVSAPRIMAAMKGGRARLSGDFTHEEAEILAGRLSEAAKGR